MPFIFSGHMEEITMNRTLPIGNDQFRLVREKNEYYVDKSLFIKEFLEKKDTAALITRPRRFGKTLNMTMLREFLDITRDSRKLFDGLNIMETEYVKEMNSRPVVYFTFKDCTGNNPKELMQSVWNSIFQEYRRYYEIFEGTVDKKDLYYIQFYQTLQDGLEKKLDRTDLSFSIQYLLTAVCRFYGKEAVLLVDEYDQPVLCSYENEYREEMGDFFSAMYGAALKGNEYVSQALLTGIQRVAKESIFSKLNNLQVYSVVCKDYAGYFGMTADETQKVLEHYGLGLTEEVRRKYNGYRFGGMDIYNPWSVLNYAKNKRLGDYWVNTSTNYLIRQSLGSAGNHFRKDFDRLIEEGETTAGVNLETSFIELQDTQSLWGLLVNSGYVTVSDDSQGHTVKHGPDRIDGRSHLRYDNTLMKMRIPNDEVRAELQKIVAEQAHISDDSLRGMFWYLQNGDMEHFMSVYQEIVTSCTSYFDAKENAYHMLFLGMCISLRGLYKVTSNVEMGLGRSDIRLEALRLGLCHVLIEFKQGEDIMKLKEEALRQIMDKQYYAGLEGRVLCIGIAHDKKMCRMAWEYVEVKS